MGDNCFAFEIISKERGAMKKSITAKLGGMLLSTFLPLNLLAIILCSIIIHLHLNRPSQAVHPAMPAAPGAGRGGRFLTGDGGFQ